MHSTCTLSKPYTGSPDTEWAGRGLIGSRVPSESEATALPGLNGYELNPEASSSSALHPTTANVVASDQNSARTEHRTPSSF